MQTLNRILLIGGLALTVGSCTKIDSLPSYVSGVAPVLTASATSATPTANDSNLVIQNLSWTGTHYSNTDTTKNLYTIQIDSAGKNFASALTFKVVTGNMTTSILAKELNAFLLNVKGYAATVQVGLEFRVAASKANYNEQYFSNSVPFKFTPYVPAFPDVADVPVVNHNGTNGMTLVGDATPNGWNNSWPNAGQVFTQVSPTFFTLTMRVSGGKQYLAIPEPGSWNNKYALADNSIPGIEKGGYFGYNYGQNFIGPKTDGLYLFRFDFAQGYFDVTKVGY